MNGLDKMGGEKCGMLTGSGNPRVGVNSNFHPTVKNLALMEYLIKMVTPKGGIVLDPFAGSGTTLVACKMNGFRYIGIELTAEYIPIIEARLNAVKNIKEENQEKKK
jgi:DNA modification methylase